MGYVVMTMCKAWVIRGEAPRGEGRGVGGREGDREGRRQGGNETGRDTQSCTSLPQPACTCCSGTVHAHTQEQCRHNTVRHG